MEAGWYPYGVQFPVASKELVAGSALRKTLLKGLPPINWGYSPLGLFEPPVNFLPPSSSIIERLAIPATTFSLFPLEIPTYDHDDGIPNSTMYESCGFLRVRAGKVVLAGSNLAGSASGNHGNKSRL